MSDERDETRGSAPFDDATQADMSRPDDPPRAAVGQPGDATAVGGRAGDTLADPGGAGDATMPDAGRVGDVAVAGAGLVGDATAVQSQPASGSTSIMPAAVDDWAPSRANPVWSGRAEVRAPRSGQTDYQEFGWAAGPERGPSDRWWMPIVVGIIVLVLLAALGWGIYLIVRNAGSDNTPAPVTTTSAAPAPTTAATTQSATPSSAPTTTVPTTQPTTSAPTTNPTTDAVAIPALKGLSLADAQAALRSVGMTSRFIYRGSAAPPNTVIDSDPPEGQEVPPDTVVTLVVASPQANTPTATATTAAGG